MIQRLPSHLVHQIAAGEVIERPASALKELIENAIDAQAQKICVAFRRGGKDFLEIEDDGTGFVETDLALAFESHATSKLRAIEDFESLVSYGFRGEALASLGSVADVVIRTSHADSQSGWEIRNAFGQHYPPQPIDKRIGSRVVIRNLFERLPARREFLKSDRAEAQALHLMIRRYALARPEVMFEVTDLDSERRRIFARSALKDRVMDVIEASDPSRWMEVNSGESDGLGLNAVVVAPRYVSQEGCGIFLFINRRPVRDSKVEAAIRRAYEGFTEFAREASGIIHLSLDPSLVDINVHPMKTQVRFKDPERVFSFVHRCLKNSFATSHRESTPADVSWPSSSPSVTEGPRRPLEWGVAPRIAPESVPKNLDPQPTLWAASPSSYDYLFSIDETFWVCRRGPDLVLFDQHALHERVLYEELRREWTEKQKIASQRLLFPVTISAMTEEDLDARDEMLCRLGFEVRSLSQGRQSITAAPACLKSEPERVLKAVIESWQGADEFIVRDVLATMACHSALRAHDRVDVVKIREILARFDSEDALGHCPHGRPTFVRIGVRDLEKLFHRVI